MRRDANEPEHYHPSQTDADRAAKQVVPPAARRVVYRRVGVVGVNEETDVREYQSGPVSRSWRATNASASNSSTRWLSLSRSIPGRKPK